MELYAEDTPQAMIHEASQTIITLVLVTLILNRNGPGF
jgi:hypothetical protein